MAITPVTATGVNAPGKRGRKRTKQRGPTGLYDRKAGEFAAQQDPEGYIGYQAGQAGSPATGGSSYADWFNDVGMRDIYGGYKTALGGNERLSLRDYMKQAGGANLQDQLNQEYQHWQSTYDPENYWAGHMGRQGIDVTGLSDRQRYLAGPGMQKRLAQYHTLSDQNPSAGMTFDEFLNGQYAAPSEVVSGSGTYSDLDKGKGKGRKKGRR